jgi:periplasmic copper chaperone A
MKRLLLAGLVLLTGLAVGPTAHAHEFKIGDLEIIHPVARPTMGAAANSAVYFTIKNEGEADVLIDVYGPDADAVELHASVMEGEVMTMQHLEEGIEIPAMSEVRLSPGGEHVMLTGLAAPLNVYDTFPLTLVFKNAGAIEVEVYVVDPADLGDEMEHDMDGDMDNN